MKKLPTAEKFKDESFYHGIGFYHYSGKDITQDVIKMMIEFAKLHVNAALKEASEKVIANSITPVMGGRSIIKRVNVNKESILKAYPLNLIK